MKRIKTKLIFIIPIVIVIATFSGVTGAQMTSQGHHMGSSHGVRLVYCM
jgi:hypothetical protein